MLSILPQFAAAWISYPISDNYACVVVVSSSLSLIWHATHERYTTIFVADYFFAMVWTLFELSFADSSFIGRVILLNAAVAFLNALTDSMSFYRIVSYDAAHTVWHIISSGKAIYVASCLLEPPCRLSPPHPILSNG